jgi:hypothetical protein
MENHFENRGEEDSWWQEAEIIGVTDRQMQRWSKRYQALLLF